MYYCRSCFENAALYPRQGGVFFECCSCSRKYTPEEVRGPFSVVTGGDVLLRGRPFDVQDRCLNPGCDSLTWAFVDDPAPGRTHRQCCGCRADWPEVPQTADRCFWCHHTRTRDIRRNGVMRRECGLCCREWLHPDAPAPPDPQAESRRIAFEERDATERELDRRRHAQPEPPEYVLRQCPRTGNLEAKPTYGVRLTQQDQDDILFADRVSRAQVVRQAVDDEIDRRHMYEVDDFVWVLSPSR